MKMLWPILLVFQLPAQQLYVPNTVAQGQILQSFIYPVRNLDSVEFTLLNSQQKVMARSSGFLFNYERGAQAKQLDARWQAWVHIGLLGISSGQVPGHYLLRARLAGSNLRSQFWERPIYIHEHDFPLETITISAKIESLLHPRNPDIIARQRLQSKRLWAILKSSSPSNLYYSSALLRPLAEGPDWTSSPYGYVRKYVYPSGKVVSNIRKGNDIAAPQGVQVRSSGDGLVRLAENRLVTGKTVIIAVLPGVYLKYQHLSVLKVRENSIVRRGDLIGEVAGFSTGNHLHTELWVSARQVDPARYFAAPLIDTNQIISMIDGN